MKLCLLICAVTGSLAVAPPRIELDLTLVKNYTEDFAAICPAGNSTLASCPFPVARAYDHKDGERPVTTRVYRVDNDGVPCQRSSPTACQVASVDFAVRATYVFEYDAEDAIGNKAQQVTFELTLDDLVFPTIDMCRSAGAENDDYEAWEAASNGGNTKLCTTASASDNIDDMSDRLRYQLFEFVGDQMVRVCPAADDNELSRYDQWRNDPRWIDYDTAGLASCANKKLNTTTIGRFMLTLKACDAAGTTEDGTSGSGFAYSADPPYDNCVTSSKAIVVQDTTQPVITVHGWGVDQAANASGAPLLHECCSPATVTSDALISETKCIYGETYPSFNGPYANTDGPFAVTVQDDFDDMVKNPMNIDASITLTSGTVLLPDTPNTVPPLPVGELGTYTIKYDATDSQQRKAETKQRSVEVKDTTPPTAKLTGENVLTHTVFESPNHLVDPWATCEDRCDANIAQPTAEWIGPVFNERAPGTYTRRYTCRDASNNEHYVERTIIIEDKGKPEISVMGTQDMTIEASNTVEYTDEGATCQDYVDGVLSHAVEVSGHVVNMRIPDKYVIKYDCIDLNNNKATQKRRTVTVEDTTCPEITLKGDNVIYLEASFNYTDPGATGSDTLDGETAVTTENDNIYTQNKYHRQRSCREIKQKAAENSDAVDDGYYFITTSTTTDGFKRIRVFCDMTNKVTYKKCQINCTRSTRASGAGCAQFGLQPFDWDPLKTGRQYNDNYFQPDGPLFSSQIERDLFHPDNVPADAATDQYMCGTNDADAGDNDWQSRALEEFAGINKAHAHDWTTHQAEYGKFIITYRTKDKAGNSESRRHIPTCNDTDANDSNDCPTWSGTKCGSAPKRTVIVKDTLPPVISLHLKGHGRIHQSAYNQVGLGSRAQTAHLKSWTVDFGAETVDNAFMGERTSDVTTAWVYGAIVSAVAGLALLSYSLRKKQSIVVVDV